MEVSQLENYLLWLSDRGLSSLDQAIKQDARAPFYRRGADKAVDVCIFSLPLDAKRLDDAQRQLLQKILQAVACDFKTLASLAIAPLLAADGSCQEGLGCFEPLLARLLQEDAKRYFFFGEELNPLFNQFIGQKGGLYQLAQVNEAKAILLPSLADILAFPPLKRLVWQAIKGLNPQEVLFPI